MTIAVEKAKGFSKAEALIDAASKGLVVIVQEAEAGSAEAPHWHKWDTHLYLIDGEFRNLDPNNPNLVLEAGDIALFPKKLCMQGSMQNPAL